MYETLADAGFPAQYNWTLHLVVQLIHREWGVTYPLKGASKLLHARGLNYTRPIYTLQKTDPVKQQTFLEETFPILKKADRWNH